MGKAENAIEQYLVDLCEKHNIFCRKFVSPGNTGVPDRLIIYDGDTIYIETKAPTGSLQDKQRICINDMKRHKAIVYVPYTKQEIDTIIQNTLSKKHPENIYEPITENKQKKPRKKRTSKKAVPTLNHTTSAFD